jgi:type I site-specific restriction endonuclease
MVNELGFPRGLISVEKSIGKRRTDIVCYTKEMKPILLVECKAEALDERALTQALGYNDKVQAPFICLANAHQLITFWFEGEKRVTVPFLPTYKNLYEASCRF